MLDGDVERPSLDGIVDDVSMLTTSGLHALLVFLDETSEIQFVGANPLKEAFEKVFVSFRRHLCLNSAYINENLERDVKDLHDVDHLNDIKPDVCDEIGFESQDYAILSLSDESFNGTNCGPTRQIANATGKRKKIRRFIEKGEKDGTKRLKPKHDLPDTNDGKNAQAGVKNIVGDGNVDAESEMEKRKSLRHRPSRKLLESKQMVDNLEKEDKHRSGENAAKKAFVCNDCGLSFTCKTSLIVHDRIHKGVKPYQCSECGKSFRAKSNLTVHQLQHAEVKPFSCETCGKGFPRKTSLVEHQRTHTGEKPFKCELCPAAFNAIQNLKVHRRMHAGARPFQCDQCGRDFPRKANLVIHERSHSKEKPFSCDICHKTFSQASCLKRHHSAHVGERPQFHCENCGKSFTTKHYLTVHERIHTGEKPFVCHREGCGAAFIGKRHLMLHSKAHSSGVAYEVKTLTCSRCSLQFASPHLLHLHLPSCGVDATLEGSHHEGGDYGDGDGVMTSYDVTAGVTTGGGRNDVEVGKGDVGEVTVNDTKTDGCKVDLCIGTEGENMAIDSIRHRMLNSFQSSAESVTNFYSSSAAVSVAPGSGTGATHILLPPQILFSPSPGVFISSTSSAASAADSAADNSENTAAATTTAAASASFDFSVYASSSLADSNFPSIVPASSSSSSTSTTIPLAGILVSHHRPPPSSSFLLPVDDHESAQLSSSSSFLQPLDDHASVQSSVLEVESAIDKRAADERTTLLSDSP